MMKKIAIVGYHATGSGVVEDLLRELDNVSCAEYNAELRILHDPDGISDMEYHIVSDPHRAGTGLAIKRFLSYCKQQERMEEKIFGKSWMSLVKEYADSITTLSYKGWRDLDLQFIPWWRKSIVKVQKAFFYILRKSIFSKLIPQKIQRPRWYDYYPDYVTLYSNLTESFFLEKTKAFVEKLCSIINSDNKEFVVLSQFVNSHNPMRDLRYVDDLKVIIVDRDPRDLYIHNMMHKDHRLPKDPRVFAQHYRLLRKKVAIEDPSKVLNVKYEDMIFNYDEMVKKVLCFLGIDLSHHIAKKSCFKPGVSINGTQLWLYKSSEYSEAVKIIEEELPDMLYSYPEKSERDKIIAEVDENAALREYATKH